MHNLFAVLDLTPSVEVDASELRKVFLKKVHFAHPDFNAFDNASAEEREQSLYEAALANEAYRVLGNPLLRLQHILQLEGVLDENQQPTHPDAKLPAAFLAEMMDLNLEVEEAALMHDAATMTTLQTQLAARHQATFAALQALLTQALALPASKDKASLLHTAVGHWLQLKYLQRLNDRLQAPATD